MTTPVSRRSKFDSVQCLRFLAALLVVATHATQYAHDRLDSDQHIWRLGGTVGVEIFFQISGFVMIVSTASLIGRPDAWKYFAVRRLLRIVPLYWIATTLKALIMLVAGGLVLYAALAPHTLVYSYLFLPTRNIEGHVEPLLGVGWTLVFEMFFYLVFTVALFLRRDPLKFCAVILTLCALGSLFRPDDWPPVLVYLSPIVLCFLVGMILGAWVLDRDTAAMTRWMGFVVLIWTVLALADPPAGSWFDWESYLRHFAVAGVLIAAVAFDPVVSRWLPRFTVWLGDASYSLYLFHPMTAPAIPVVLNRLGLISTPLSIVLSLIAMPIMSAVVYVVVERPVTRFLQARLPYVKVHPAGAIETTP